MHIPVLQKEVLKYLVPKPNENFIDCTFGSGGHSAAILEKNAPLGKVLGIEIDPELYKESGMIKTKNRLILVNDSYVNLKDIVEKYKFKPVNGILLDLGMSSWHLEESGRGFSFLKNEPLIMRYSSHQGFENSKFTPTPKFGVEARIPNPKFQTSKDPLTAEKIINEWSEKEIEKILREYGEEKFAQRIAKRIVAERKIRAIETTFQLKEIIKKATPFWYHRQKIHFATRTFQALRITVNQELENLKKVLPQAAEILEKGGRLAVISFHSLEDRIVKNFFKEQAVSPVRKSGDLKPALSENKEWGLYSSQPSQGTELSNGVKNYLRTLTQKPIRPQFQEIKLNPGSRSSKLRVAQKT